MDKKIVGIGIIIFALITIITSIITITSYDYFYDMKVNNCEDIMNADYQVSTSAVSSCIKFHNYPFMEFTLMYIMGWGMIIVDVNKFMPVTLTELLKHRKMRN